MGAVAKGWDPVQVGDVYCAPACGLGCKRVWYNAAVVAANELCASLGEGWKPRVWENMGWHFSAISPCGRIKLHPSRSRYNENTGAVDILGGYTAFLGDRDSSGGRWSEHGKTPKGAIKAVINRAKEDLDAIKATLEDLGELVEFLEAK